MAFTKATLSMLFQTLEGGQKWWTYSTADSIATVLGAGYVTSAADYRMAVGDIVWAFTATANATGLTEGAEVFSFTTGLGSLFTAAPAMESCMVSSISAGGAATLVPTKSATLTDNSGGVASQTIGATFAKQTIIIPLQLADIATGDFKVAVPFAGSITSTLFRTGKPASTASKLATLTASVNGTPVTGGAIALTTANQNAIGGTVAGSAITALNTFTAGQTIGATASAVTAFVEGDGWVEHTVINQDLANTIASLIKF